MFILPCLNAFINNEYFISINILSCTIFSVLFWLNPIKNSNIHFIDSIIARITLINLIISNILKPVSYYLYLNLFFILLSFFLSNFESQKKWLSLSHQLSHLLFHMIVFSTFFYQ